MLDDVQVVKGIYERLARGDVVGILAKFAPDAEFRLAEGHPYQPDGHPWTGPEQNGREFFGRAGREWADFAISTTAFSIAGSTRFFSIGLRRVISASASSPPFS